MFRAAYLFAALSLAAVRIASAKDVFAHFMMQNAYAYDVGQWETDIAAAQQIGIDGFALNWVPPNCQDDLSWQAARIDDAYTAAAQMNFKLMLSFDMSWTSCSIYWNQTYMAQSISRYSGSPATYRWNSNVLVSTYGGDTVSQYGNQFFQGLKDMMKSYCAITLSPALTSYASNAQTSATQAASSLVSDYPSIDGYLNWQAWPLNVQQNITATPDLAFQSQMKQAGRTGPYIMAVSPWQYKDLNDGNPLDSWVAYSDTLFSNRFSSLTSNPAIEPDIIELLTWNDFCESHYLRNLPSQDITAKDFVELGSMSDYVYGMNHAPWRVIAKYYISWWKTGSPPPVSMDQVVFWYRIHPKAAVCTSGSSTPVRNNQYPVDAVFAWALVSGPSTVSISVGSNQYWTFEADASGPAMSMVPFPSDIDQQGITPQVAIMRNGVMVQVANGSQPISSACGYQNFNPVVNLVGPGVNR